MEERLNKIIEAISKIEGVRILKDFEPDGFIIKGIVSIVVETVTLNFNVEIFNNYPFQFHDSECIRFLNSDLLEYNHVNQDGSICVHTYQCIDLEKKLELDFSSLKHWILKYYINKEKDNHYEHIIIPFEAFEDSYEIFLFTEVDYKFSKGEFGYFYYRLQSQGYIKDKISRTNLVQSFEINKTIYPCKWSKHYQSDKDLKGIFLFLKTPPVENKRFAIKNWSQLEPYVDQNFFDFLSSINKGTPVGKRPPVLTLLIGYDIGKDEIYWQSILIKSTAFPNYGAKSDIPNRSYIGKFHNQKIIWAQTRNISYNYFFGRGTLNEKFTKGKILIIGIGAIGSIVATTLVRGGCTSIDICDHDIKESENVCRSEYLFLTGITNKIFDLTHLLRGISPFVDVNMFDKLTDYSKLFFNDPSTYKVLEDVFNKYDIIFDCTTDNDLAYIFDKLETSAEIINLSITNKAKNLVCVVKPNIYKWICDIFPLIGNDVSDLYNPTGCWSPTFKASYNDIEVFVQFALKHINLSFEKSKTLSNFYLTNEFEHIYKINLHEF